VSVCVLDVCLFVGCVVWFDLVVVDDDVVFFVVFDDVCVYEVGFGGGFVGCFDDVEGMCWWIFVGEWV